MNGHLEEEQPQLGDLLTIVISHLLTGMILQVGIYQYPKKEAGPGMLRKNMVAIQNDFLGTCFPK